MGIDGIEHGFNAASDFRSQKAYGVCEGNRQYIDSLDMNSHKIRTLLELMIQKGVHLNSTLAIYEASIPNRAYADPRSLEIMSLALKKDYQNRRKRLDAKQNDSTRNRRLKRIMNFEYQFFKKEDC